MYVRWHVVLAFVLALCPASVAQGQSRQTPLKSASKSALKSSRNWISGSLMMKPGVYSSPDGQYYVEVYGFGAIGEVGIQLYSGRPSHQPHPPHADLLGHVNPGPVSGLVWVPRHLHTLVFASRGDPGHSMLALWSGGRGVYLLHRVVDDQMDVFKLYAVSRDGRTIVYGWGLGINGEIKPLRKRYLRLPTK